MELHVTDNEGNFYILSHHHGSFWLRNQEQETMQVEYCELYDLFDKFFKEKF